MKRAYNRITHNPVGETYINNRGEKAIIIEYFRTDNCTIKFEDDTIVYKRDYRHVISGSFRKPTSHKGEVYKNSQNLFYEVIDFINSKNCTVRFLCDNSIYPNLYYCNIKKRKC